MPKKKAAAKKPAPKKAKNPVAAAPEPAAPAALPPGETANVALSALHASPLNPRKAFNEATVAELAESIAANGVLQNLVVRRRPRGGFEIIAGERRFRALTTLAEGGRWDSDAARIPVRIVEGDDGTVRALALLENLQREDISPMEEAEAFAALNAIDGVAWSTAIIAQRIGKTQRHVQKRMQLVLRLDDQVKDALREGKINLEHAKAFALGPHKLQRQVLGQVKRGADWLLESTDRLVEEMAADLIPVRHAIFDRTLYAGDIVDDETSGESYFGDVAEFKSLQDAAVAAKIEEFKTTYAWAKVVEGGQFWTFVDARKGDKDAGAIIGVFSDGEVRTRERVLEPKKQETPRATDAKRNQKKAPAKATPKAPPKPEDIRWLTRAQVEHIKAAKTLAMRRAVVDDVKAGLCLTILGLIGTSEVDVDVPGQWQSRSRYTPVAPPIAVAIRRETAFAPILACTVKHRRKDIVDKPGTAHLSEDEQAAMFRALMGLEIDALLVILATAIEPRIGSWVSHDGKQGDSPLAIAIAELTGASHRLAVTWAPTPEYLAAYRRETLQNLAGWTEHKDGFNKLKKGEQVKLLASMPAGTWTPERFAELQFLDDDALQKAMAAPAPMPATIRAQLAAETAAKGRCRECQAHEGGKHHKRCTIGKAGEKTVSADSCTPITVSPATLYDEQERAAAVHDEPPAEAAQ